MNLFTTSEKNIIVSVNKTTFNVLKSKWTSFQKFVYKSSIFKFEIHRINLDINIILLKCIEQNVIYLSGIPIFVEIHEIHSGKNITAILKIIYFFIHCC